MNDQDFFFDEEPDDKKPAAAKPATSRPAGKAPVPGPVSTRSSSAREGAIAAPEVSSDGPDRSSTMAVAALVGLAGLLLGAILGFLLGNAIAKATLTTKTTSTTTAPAATTAGTTGGTTSGQAGELTPEQQASGQLPAGHPAVNIPTTGTPDATATK